MTQDYDAIPYESSPITDAHPYKLAALGHLLGLTPPDPSTARILELGCAEGGTLIPLARLWPQAHLLGLELSAVQTRAGNELIAALGLTNVKIQQADILHIDASLGQFDYIIAHGVFSWVPHEVQEKILSICHEHLSPHGMAYISYNVNPGWRLRGAMRDMFAYHLRDITQPQQRLEQALAFCEQLDASLGNSKTIISEYLREEIAHIRKAKRAYVFHEYLESVNEPILFTDFLSRITQHQLNYVCDTELYSMFPSSYGTAAEKMLESFNDAIVTEQYADFLRMRTFRQSILCHENFLPDYEIDLDRLNPLSIYANLSAEKQPNLRTDQNSTFITASGKNIPISHPLTKAILVHLHHVYPDALPLQELFKVAQQQLQQAGATAFVPQLDAARGELFNLFANNLLGLAIRPHHFEYQVERPCVTALARIQAQHAENLLSTIWSETLTLDHFATRLVHLLDGTRTKQELIDQLHAEIAQSKINSPTIKSIVTPQGITQNMERLLALFARNGILQ